MCKSEVEKAVSAEIQKRGGWETRLKSPLRRGVPDRVCCLPGIGAFFIEFKSYDDALAPARSKRLREIIESGGRVFLVRSIEDFLWFLEKLEGD